MNTDRCFWEAYFAFWGSACRTMNYDSEKMKFFIGKKTISYIKGRGPLITYGDRPHVDIWEGQ